MRDAYRFVDDVATVVSTSVVTIGMTYFIARAAGAGWKRGTSHATVDDGEADG